VTAHLERKFACGISKLRLTRCEGGPEDLRGPACGRHRGLVRSERAARDVWDQTIRKQIKACALSIPVISGHTHERREGYFRLEWRLAVDRSNLISATQAFLIPVVIDNTREDDEAVPERIRDIHWTRLPGGETPPAFVERVGRLLSGNLSREPSRTAAAAARVSAAPTIRRPLRIWWRSKAALFATIAVLVVALGYVVANRLMRAKRGADGAPVTTFAPPPHSIAVLPFVNMSGDPSQEYFSDGLTEELLNSLARINELQVAARTSSFSFKGKDVDVGTIAHKLNVSAILEGSVRRSAHTVRVTAQLNDAVTGFHIWSQSYDRELGDVLQLQAEIATAVAAALKVTLLSDASARIEVGGTQISAAFDAFLRGRKAHNMNYDKENERAAIAAFDEAIRLDPLYARAFANRSIAFCQYGDEYLDKARVDANRAIALAPELAEGHMALGCVSRASLDFSTAGKEFERVVMLDPGNARGLRWLGGHASVMGHPDSGLVYLRRALLLDPLNPFSYEILGTMLCIAHRYDEAAVAAGRAINLDATDLDAYALRGLAYYALGDLPSGVKSCEARPDNLETQSCLAILYQRLGRKTDAESLLSNARKQYGDSGAYTYARIYSQWGQIDKALEWLDAAMRLSDSNLVALKTDPLMDPLRKEPRFQAIERELKFPT
jgi:TolB-like protein